MSTIIAEYISKVNRIDLIGLLFHFLSIIRLRHTENSSINDKSPTHSLGRDSSLSSVYNFPALSKSPSWLPPVKYALPESNRYETNVTTLDNGLRVCIDVFFLLDKFLLLIFNKGCFGKAFW